MITPEVSECIAIIAMVVWPYTDLLMVNGNTPQIWARYLCVVVVVVVVVVVRVLCFFYILKSRQICGIL